MPDRNVYTLPITGPAAGSLNMTTTGEKVNGSTQVIPPLRDPPSTESAYVEWNADNKTGGGTVDYRLFDLDAPNEVSNLTLSADVNASRSPDIRGSLVQGNRLTSVVDVRTADAGSTSVNVEGHLVVIEHD